MQQQAASAHRAACATAPRLTATVVTWCAAVVATTRTSIPGCGSATASSSGAASSSATSAASGRRCSPASNRKEAVVAKEKERGDGKKEGGNSISINLHNRIISFFVCNVKAMTPPIACDLDHHSKCADRLINPAWTAVTWGNLWTWGAMEVQEWSGSRSRQLFTLILLYFLHSWSRDSVKTLSDLYYH